ncbi:MFS transporter [Pseudomonas juntendi]|nr:MFS transporter [Pseudomonas juntendi]
MPRWLALLGGVLIVLYALIARDNLIEQRLALFAMTFAISIVATWMDIPLNALAVQWLPRHEQVRAGSIRAAALFVGAIVGGGAMLLVQSRLGWQAPFVIMGAALALGVLALLLVARRLPSVPTPAAMAPGLVADWAGFSASRRHASGLGCCSAPSRSSGRPGCTLNPCCSTRAWPWSRWPGWWALPGARWAHLPAWWAGA